MPNGQGPVPINQLPRGLLSLLDIKNLGRNPLTLNQDFVQGILELSDFYLSFREHFRGLTNSVNIPGFFTADVIAAVGVPIPQIPQDEVWLVHRVSWRSEVPLTNGPYTCSAAFIQPGIGAGGIAAIHSLGVEVSGSATEIPASGVSWGKPLLFVQGAFFGINVRRAPGAGVDRFDVYVEATRLRI